MNYNMDHLDMDPHNYGTSWAGTRRHRRSEDLGEKNKSLQQICG